MALIRFPQRTLLALVLPLTATVVPERVCAAACASDDECDFGFQCDEVETGTGGSVGSGGASFAKIAPLPASLDGLKRGCEPAAV